MGSLTRMTNFEKLSDKGELGIILGRLMMATNDIGIANEALGQWMGELTGQRKTRQEGAQMYFVRILISHVFEALTIINKIISDPELMKSIDRSPKQIQQFFNKCAKVIGTEDYKLMKSMRSKRCCDPT
jgi:hypothetical protein